MLKSAGLGFSGLAVLAMMSLPGALAQSKEELEAYEAELIDYEKELDQRAKELDELEIELEDLEDEFLDSELGEAPPRRRRAAPTADGEEQVADADAAAPVGEDGVAMVPVVEYFSAEPYVPENTRSFDRTELTKSNINALSDMLPGNAAGLLLQTSDSNAAALELSLRGVSGTTVHQGTGDPGVGVFIDGVYIARSQGLTMDLLDLERIDVQRGPQGVLSGRNTSGGAVHLVSRKPTGELDIEQTLLFGGEYDEVKSVTHVNLPRLADIVNAKVSYMLDDHKGWVVNPGQGSQNNDFWSRDNQAVRIAVNLDKGGPIAFDYAFEDAEITSTMPYFQAVDMGEAKMQETARSGLNIPESDIDIQHHNQTMVISGEKASITSIIGYREVESTEFTNYDGLFGAGVTPTTAPGDQIRQDQFSVDLRLQRLFYKDQVDLIVGVNNLRETVELQESATSGTSDVDSFSVYAQGVMAIGNQLEFLLGWRETRDEKTVQSLRRNSVNTGQQTNIEDDNTSFEVAFRLQPSEHTRAWLSLARGFKAAGASLYAEGTQPYAAEEAETIEAGFSGSAWKQKINYTVAAYSTNLENRQLVFLDPDNLRITDIINDPNSTSIEGVELNLSVQPLKDLTIATFYSYMDYAANAIAEPYDGAGSFSPGAGPAVVVEGERAPQHMGWAAIDYQVGKFEAGDLALRLEYSSIGDYFFNSLNPEQDSRDILNARVNMSGLQLEDDAGQLEVGIWAKNILDEEYTASSQYVTSSPRASKSGNVVSSFGEPFTYGVDIRYAF
ncbi:MAG: TonB-dependent receptor [Gammaproteobacteria bacterium]|nr:TonB-dependent receptor [Gammaproteobacteria bacterium]MBT8151539.1 TonB-dependent receptor [Gammaproteobacteria bacterium]NNL11840.1 TonB-dependent receptor [Pseudomonadales bacterium]